MSKRPAITFKALDRYLRSLGFQLVQTRGSHRMYRHANPDGMIALPGVRENTNVRPAHLAAVRRTLQNLGLIDSDQAIADIVAQAH